MQIVRINTRYNIIWVIGQNSPGETNNLVQIFDTMLPLKNCEALEQEPHFPTNFHNFEDDIPEEYYVDDIHNFNDPTITFKEDE